MHGYLVAPRPPPAHTAGSPNPHAYLCPFRTSSSLPPTRIDTPLAPPRYLPHHIPAITYDGLTRILASGQGAAKPDACAAAALALPQCVISTKCSTALRPTGATKCRCAARGARAVHAAT